MTFTINDYLFMSDGKDCAVPVQKLLQNVDSSGQTILEFPKDTYHIYHRRCGEKYLYISNHDQGLKSIAFDIDKRDNLLVEGNGSEFIFHGRVLPFAIENSRNVTVQNLSIDYERPFFSEGVVLEADHEHVVLRIDPELYPYYIEDETIHFYSEGEWDSTWLKWFYEFDAAKRTPAYNKGDSGLQKQKVRTVKVQENAVCFYANFAEQHTVGNVINITHEHRYNPAFFINESENVTLSNIRIYHAAAMGVIGQNSKDITLENVTVSAREGSGRYGSALNDASHFVNCEGTIREINCLFRHQMDDGCNIHGAYNPVSRVYSPQLIEVENMHPQQNGVWGYRVGDRLSIVDPVSQYPQGSAKIISVEPINQKFLCLQIEADIAIRVGDVVNNITRFPEVEIRGCRMGHNRARALLMSSNRKIVIEHCEFFTSGNAINCGGEIHNWFESGPIKDITVRNNRFINCGYAKLNRSFLEISAKVDLLEEEHPLHGRVVIEDNDFLCFQAPVLTAESVDNVVFSGNSIIRSFDYEPFAEREQLLVFEKCGKVTVEKNAVEGFKNAIMS